MRAGVLTRTSASVRSGYVAAKTAHVCPPSPIPTSVARSAPTASRTARMSSILVSIGPRSRGRSDSPVPRLSNMIRRENDAKRSYICRQSELNHGNTRLLNIGTSTRSRGPSPKVWYAMATSPLRVYSISGTCTAKVSHRTNSLAISPAGRRSELKRCPTSALVVEGNAHSVFGLSDCELPELGQRHLVALDANDSARRTLGRSLAKLIRLLLACAQRLVALPEGDQLGAAALAVDQRDEALEAAELPDLRNDLLLRVARPFVEALRRAFEGTDARRAGPLAY